MLTSLLSAATWYADVALIVLIVLFLLLGVFRGFGKSLKGGFMTIVIILGSLLLVGVLHNTVMTSSLGTGLQDKLSVSSEGWGDAFTRDVYYADGSFKVQLDDGTFQNVADTDGIKGKIANWLAGKFISPESEAVNPAATVPAEQRQSVADVCVYNITALIVAAALFLVLCIAMSIVCSILKGLTKGMHDSSSTAVRVIDKILGGIVGLVLGATFVFLVLAILAAFSDKAPSIVQYINDSTVCKFFYDLNPIGKMFEKIFTKG